MFYFVPSWYRQDRKWYSTTLPFYYVSKNMMFDDAVNLLRMFQQSGEATIHHIFEPFFISKEYCQKLYGIYLIPYKV